MKKPRKLKSKIVKMNLEPLCDSPNAEADNEDEKRDVWIPKQH